MPFAVCRSSRALQTSINSDGACSSYREHKKPMLCAANHANGGSALRYITVLLYKRLFPHQSASMWLSIFCQSTTAILEGINCEPPEQVWLCPYRIVGGTSHSWSRAHATDDNQAIFRCGDKCADPHSGAPASLSSSNHSGATAARPRA